MTRFTSRPRSTAPATALASILALALAAPAAHAQSDAAQSDAATSDDTSGAAQTDGGAAGASAENGAQRADSDTSQAAEDEHSALEQAVLDELEDIGIGSLTVDKLSSGQLAGILLTLTATDRQDKEEAVTTIAADSGYRPTDVDAQAVTGNETVRGAVEDALVRAGWSADVSQITDAQVAALYGVLAERGRLDPERIEDVFSQ